VSRRRGLVIRGVDAVATGAIPRRMAPRAIESSLIAGAAATAVSVGPSRAHGEPRRATMMHNPSSPRPSFLLCLGVLASIAGCQRDPPIFERDASRAVAEHYCAELFGCKCLDPAGFASEEGCVATLSADLLDRQLEAVEAELRYDASCIDARIDAIATLGCSRDATQLESCTDCFAYHGAVPQDAPCTRHGEFSDCEQGLTCVTREGFDGAPIDVCVPACLRADEGEPCAFAGPGFYALRDCDDGLVCDLDASGRCVPLPGAGLPCVQEFLCSADAWCDASADPPICAALKSNGEACANDVECVSTWCDGGERCRQPIVQGVLCVFDRDRCATGLICTEELPLCSPADALQCQAPPTSP
jgi:hypothetical protein